MYRSYSQQCRQKLTSPPKGSGVAGWLQSRIHLGNKIFIGSRRSRPAEWVYSPIGNRIYYWRRRRRLSTSE
jgi:hypothetical protein